MAGRDFRPSPDYRFIDFPSGNALKMAFRAMFDGLRQQLANPFAGKV